MWNVNLIFVAVLILIAGLGALIGFGRSLKWTTRGIVGIVMSVIFCVLFGGALLGTESVGGLVAGGNEFFAGVWGFFGIIRLATVIYFVALFFAVQIVRILITIVIKRIVEIEKPAIKVLNRVAGAVFLAAFCFSLCLLGLAGLRFFEGTEFTMSILSNIENSFLCTLYVNNPISFV
jgi:hypothetical protein